MTIQFIGAIHNNSIFHFKLEREVLCIRLFDITTLNCDGEGSNRQDIYDKLQKILLNFLSMIVYVELEQYVEHHKKSSI